MYKKTFNFELKQLSILISLKFFRKFYWAFITSNEMIISEYIQFLAKEIKKVKW